MARVGVPTADELKKGERRVFTESGTRRYEVWGDGRYVEIFAADGVRPSEDEESPPEGIWKLAYKASTVSCTCPGFANRSACRHLTFIKKSLSR